MRLMFLDEFRKRLVTALLRLGYPGKFIGHLCSSHYPYDGRADKLQPKSRDIHPASLRRSACPTRATFVIIFNSIQPFNKKAPD